MAGAAAEVDIGAVSTIIVTAVGAAEVVDGLPGEGLGGEAGAADDLLAVAIGVTGVGGSVTRHQMDFK
jgi:hypothetical protein